MLGLGHVPLSAQTLSPGDVQRQVQPAPASELPKLNTIPPRLYGPSTALANERTVRVISWDLVGNTAIDTATLLQWLKPFTEVNLTLRQINEAAALLQQIYQDAGLVTRVLVPAQDVTDGSVTLRIVESRLGTVTVSPDPAARVDLERVRQSVLKALTPKTLLSTDEVDRGVFLADDWAGIRVASSFEAGEQDGTSNVLLLTSPEPLAAISLTADNGNSRSVGANRVVGNLTLNSPFGWGESLSAQALHSKGSDFYRLGAQVPLGLQGIKLSPYASTMRYEVITPDNNGAKQDISGRADAKGLDASYPVRRQSTHNLYLQAGWRTTDYSSRAIEQRTQFDIDVMQLGVQGNWLDSMLGGGSNSYTLMLHRSQKSTDAFATDSNQSDYKKISWSASRQQLIRSGLTFSASIQAQDTQDSNIDGSDNMSLGGPNGVRAYPSGEASGPVGRLVNLELRWRLNPAWQIAPFYDWGQVSQRNESAGGPASYSLKGAGMGLNWTSTFGATAQLTYARRLGENPNALDTGKDQDGSLKRDRIWLSLNQSF
jgi:hemolysin activation/secretion protein